jgi:hypothetical protein
MKETIVFLGNQDRLIFINSSPICISFGSGPVGVLNVLREKLRNIERFVFNTMQLVDYLTGHDPRQTQFSNVTHAVNILWVSPCAGYLMTILGS